MTAQIISNEDSSAQSTANNNRNNNNKVATVDAYPLGTDTSLLSKYSKVKTIYYIRHAEGSHNVNKNYRHVKNLDARLTEKGLGQCQTLAERIRVAQDPIAAQLKESVQLIITSPLTRCMQTALLSLEPVVQARPDTRVVAHEGVRETVNYNCDRRRPISQLKSEFQQVDFSHVTQDHDGVWSHYESWLGPDTDYTTHRESAQIYKVAERGRSFLWDYLVQCSEEHVAICSHRAFSRAFFNFGHGEATNCTTLPQSLDDRDNPVNIPVVQYMGDKKFEESLRADYDNCELRSMILAFP